MARKTRATAPAMPSSSGRDTVDWSDAVVLPEVGVGVGWAACGSGPNALSCASAVAGRTTMDARTSSRATRRMAAENLDGGAGHFPTPRREARQARGEADPDERAQRRPDARDPPVRLERRDRQPDADGGR